MIGKNYRVSIGLIEEKRTMTADEKVGNGVPNGSLYGKQISKIDLLKEQVSRDSIESQGKWKPFKDIRFVIFAATFQIKFHDTVRVTFLFLFGLKGTKLFVMKMLFKIILHPMQVTCG